MEKNHLIIEKLSQLYEIYRRDPEYKFKAKALSTSLPLLNAYQQPILHGKQAMKEIKGVGKGIAERIDEILATGSLAELEEHTERIRKYAVIEELKSITGVGDVRAEEWYSMGLRTVADVRRAVAEEQIAITHHIQLGLLYYDDIRERIPRTEMERLEERIAGYVREVNGGLIYQICGSYRRGNATSGDIDIIISHPDYMENIAKQRFLPKIVKRMSDDGFLVGHLTEKGDKKYMGLCILSVRAWDQLLTVTSIQQARRRRDVD